MGKCVKIGYMKKIIIVIIIIVLAGLGIYYFNKNSSVGTDTTKNQDTATTTTDTTVVPVQENKEMTVIGKSVEGRDITAYHFGTGETELMFVGGIHGGYEWNTVLVANQMIKYLKDNPNAVPSNIKVTVIPTLNPDGLYKTIGVTVASSSVFTASDVPSSQEKQIAGRFNANTVDLNRNFDCDWQEKGKWQNKTVSGGSEAFSEPESAAMKNYVESKNPKAVIVWYSSAGGIYASSCHNGVSTTTLALTNTFAKASGYPAHESFNFYEITGDMVNWLAKKEIPAISVLLTNHKDTEWSKNQKGIEAVLKYFAK